MGKIIDFNFPNEQKIYSNLHRRKKKKQKKRTKFKADKNVR